MIREPSPCSMTADLEHETERENLAQRLFVAERDLAEARKTVLRLEAENAEITSQVDSVTNSGLRDAELLSAARVEIASMATTLDSLRRRVKTLETENADMVKGREAMSEEWDKSFRLQEHRFNAMKAVATAAVDAI